MIRACKHRFCPAPGQAIRYQQNAFPDFCSGCARYPAVESRCQEQVVPSMYTTLKTVTKNCIWPGANRPQKCAKAVNWRLCDALFTIPIDIAGRYFVSCRCESESVTLPATVSTAGMDAVSPATGIGFTIRNPRCTTKQANQLSLLQGCLSNKQKCSTKRARVACLLATLLHEPQPVAVHSASRYEP